MPLPPRPAVLLLGLAALAGLGAQGSCGDGAAPVTRNALVVYNGNAPDAASIAIHYAAARAIPTEHLCPVELPPGHYASKDHLLAARDQIVEGCLCALIPSAERPAPCDASNADAIRAKSTITHVALIRGIPARLYGTPWPTDFEEPSFDFYLAYLLYRSDDIFAPGTSGVAANTYLTPDLIDQANTWMILSAPPLDPGLHKEVAYGRIEAIDRDRTLALIDRTLAAEALGSTGSFFEEKAGKGFSFLRELTGSLAEECEDYTTHEPFLFDTPESSWPSALCRAGTTWTIAKGPDPSSTTDDALRSVVPGSFMSVVPRAVRAGLFLGTAPNANKQNGFNGFAVLRNWRLAGAPCTPLCRELPTQAERDACAAASADVFRELDASCVGAARGFLGHQVRSWPVQYYGFMPTGWEVVANGDVEKTPPRVLEGGAYAPASLGDDRYLHLGEGSVADPAAPECPMPDGARVPCPERVALALSHRIELVPPLPIAGSRDFLALVRHRNAASAAGRLRLRATFEDGAQAVAKEVEVPLTAQHLVWTEGGGTLSVQAAELAQVTAMTLALSAGLADGIEGFLDLDGIELWDLATGQQLVAPSAGSFAASHHELTHPGDWAATAIDRLGAIAWWGSSSHHIYGGYSFSNEPRFYGAFFMGRTLGESLLLMGGGEAGIVYGDPLYRPVAVRLHLPGVNGYGAPPGLTVTAADAPALARVYVNVLHGTARSKTVRWTIAACPALDPALCDAGALWTERVSATGATENLVVDWRPWIDLGLEQDLLLRLRVWNPGEEADELFHHAYFHYRP